MPESFNKVFNLGNKRKYAPIMVVILIGLYISALAFSLTNRFETERIRAEFELAAKEREQFLEQQIEFDLNALKAVAGLYAASKSIERDEFQIFTEFLDIKEEVTSLAWLPRVSEAQKSAFEKQVQQEGFPKFQITQFNDDHELVPTAERREYFPIYFLESTESDEEIEGLDVGVNPVNQQALEAARSTGELALTGRTQALDEAFADDDFEASAFYPIYPNDLPQDTVEARQQNLMGYVVANLRFNDIFKTMAAKTAPIGMDMYLFDLSAPAGEQFLSIYHAHHSSDDEHSDEDSNEDSNEVLFSLTIDEVKQRIYSQHILDVGQRQWAVVLVPTASFITERQTWQPWGVLVGGLLFTSLLSLYVFSSIKRNAELAHEVMERQQAQRALEVYQETLEDIVAERTTELAAQTKSNQELLARQQAIFDTVPVGIVVIKERKFIWSNPRFAEILGLDLNAVGALSTHDLYANPAEFESFGREIYPRITQGETCAVEVQMKNWQTTLPVWCNFKGRAIDVDDLTQGTIWSLEDISERKQAREQLRASAERLNAVVNVSPDLIFLLDETGLYVEVYTSAQDKLYADSAELKGKHLHEIMPAENADYFLGVIQRAITTNEMQIVEYPLPTLAGLRWFEARINRFGLELNGKQAVVFVSRDITERKESEQQLQHINEELATSNEELRVTEEELLTLTQDLRVQIAKQQETEAMLQQRTSEQEALLSTIPAIVFFKDRQSNYIAINQALAKVINVATSDSVKGKTDYDFFPIEQAEAFRADDEIVMASGQPKLNIEEPITGADGKQGWLSTSKAPVFNAQGEVVGIVGMGMDITKHKEAELALKQANLNLSAILESTTDIIFALDSDYRYTAFNSSYQTTAEYVLGVPIALGYKPLELLKFEEDRVKTKAAFDRALAGERFTVEEVYGNDEQNRLWFELAYNPIFDKDQVIGITSFTRNITERKQSEIELHESQEKFRVILENAPEAIMLVDKQGKILLANGKTEQMFGYSREELLGQEIEMLVPMGARQHHAKLVENYFNNPYSRQMGHGLQLAGQRKDGVVFPIDAGLSSIETKEGLLATVFITDISQRRNMEEAIRRSETLLKNIINNTTTIIYVKSATEGRYLLTNRAFEEWINLSSEQILGHVDYDLYPQEVASVIRLNDEEVIQSNTLLELEEIVPYRDTFQTYLSLKFPLHDEQGQPYAVCGMSTNITERKQYEDALRQSETRQRALLDAMPDMMFQMNRDGVFLDYRGAREETYVPPESIIGNNIRQVMPPPFVEMVMHYIEQTLAQNNMQTFEYELPVPSGLQQYEARMVPSGAAETTTIIRNVTNRKQAENRLKTLYQMSQGLNLAVDEQAVLEVLIENFKAEGFASTLFHFELDEQAQPIWAVLVAGYAAAGQPIAPVGTRYYLPEFPFCEIWLANPNNPILIENTATSDLLDENTRAIFLQLNIGRIVNIPIRLNNRWVGILTYQWQETRPFPPQEVETYRTIMSMSAPAVDSRRLIKDLQVEIIKRNEAEIQMRQAKEAAEAANRAKSEFLANMSHELRTPLNGILGYAQILKRDKELMEHQLNGVNIIQQSGEHLLTLINDILDLSKIEAGRIEIQTNEFDLAKFLQSIINVIRLRTEQSGLTFTYKPLTNLPIAVTGDEKRLRQVLINLLGNAVKFTKQGGVTLKVGPHYGKIRFQIEDTGVGIPEDHLELIFHPFRQVGEVYMKSEGTGLGLSISKRLVEAMNSELKVISNLGAGSTFWFDVELPQAYHWRGADTTPKPLVVGYRHASNHPLKILVVDDKATNRSLAIDLLSPLGFEMFEAIDGQEAIEQAKAIQPDIVLMDIVMPVMNGLEATRQIRQEPSLNPTHFGLTTELSHDIIIIAASASAFDNDYAESLEAGCNDFVPKPLHLDGLLQKLETLLGLQWLYESSTNETLPVETVTSEPQIAQVGPPLEFAQGLQLLAQRGQIKQLREMIDRLETEGPQYKTFVEKVKLMAKQYQLKEIEAILQPYLG